MGLKKIIFITFLIIFAALFYNYLEIKEDLEKVNVISVIDGDTLVLENINVRLLGINTPEKNMPNYKEAKELLENLTLNQEIYIENKGTDKYGRILAYAYNNKNVNLNQKILQSGLAHLYYYEKDNYYEKMKISEENARINQIGIWTPSPFSQCLELIELKYFDEGNDTENLILSNNCKEDIDVIIKDDATHIYKEKIKQGIFQKEFKDIFNDNADTLYIWDEQGRLIIFYRYI